MHIKNEQLCDMVSEIVHLCFTNIFIFFLRQTLYVTNVLEFKKKVDNIIINYYLMYLILLISFSACRLIQNNVCIFVGKSKYTQRLIQNNIYIIMGRGKLLFDVAHHMFLYILCIFCLSNVSFSHLIQNNIYIIVGRGKYTQHCTQ